MLRLGLLYIYYSVSVNSSFEKCDMLSKNGIYAQKLKAKTGGGNLTKIYCENYLGR